MKSSDLKQLENAGRVIPQWTGVVCFRVLETSNEPSKNTGSRMVSLKTEIAMPTEVVWMNEKWVIGGMEHIFYLIFEKEGKGDSIPIRGVFQFHKLLGIPEPPEGFNVEDKTWQPDDKVYKDLCFKAAIRSELNTLRLKDPETGEYSDVLDPETQKSVQRGWQWRCNIWDILARIDPAKLPSKTTKAF